MNVKHLTQRELLVNVYISQLIFLILAAILIQCFHLRGIWDLFVIPIRSVYWITATFSAVCYLAITAILKANVPRSYLDDGGINEKLFESLSILHIVFLSAFIAFCEEWLFRGAIQAIIGYVLTSAIFALLHIRYIKKPFLIITVTGLSYWMGFLYEWSHSLWPPFLAHFLIDAGSAFMIQKDIKEKNKYECCFGREHDGEE